MLVVKSLLLKVSDHCSRVLVPTFSAALLVLVCFQSTTRRNCSCSARPSRVDPVKSLATKNEALDGLQRLEGAVTCHG